MKEERAKKYLDFQKRYEAYIQEFQESGFTRKQAEKLASEFAEGKAI